MRLYRPELRVPGDVAGTQISGVFSFVLPSAALLRRFLFTRRTIRSPGVETSHHFWHHGPPHFIREYDRCPDIPVTSLVPLDVQKLSHAGSSALASGYSLLAA